MLLFYSVSLSNTNESLRLRKISLLSCGKVDYCFISGRSLTWCTLLISPNGGCDWEVELSKPFHKLDNKLSNMVIQEIQIIICKINAFIGS